MSKVHDTLRHSRRHTGGADHAAPARRGALPSVLVNDRHGPAAAPALPAAAHAETPRDRIARAEARLRDGIARLRGALRDAERQQIRLAEENARLRTELESARAR